MINKTGLPGIDHEFEKDWAQILRPKPLEQGWGPGLQSQLPVLRMGALVAYL